MQSPVKSVTVGLAAGFLGGLLGIGGGVIYVPGLVFFLGLDQRRAHASSVAVIVVSATAAAISFGAEGHVDTRAALFMFGGAAIGAPIGARLLGKLSERTLVATFAVVMVVAAIRMTIS